jgi:hypothetical protein
MNILAGSANTPLTHHTWPLGFRTSIIMATVYPAVYPSDMPPILACQEPSYEYIRPHYCVWYLTLLVLRVLCILLFWESYPQ